MLYKSLTLLAAAATVQSAAVERRQASSSVPQYFQTTPEVFAGPTPTGPAPFLAETNPAPFPSTSYIPNTPLETQVPIAGTPPGGNIFQLFGQLSHYFPNPIGFGVDEYAVPSGANITWLNMLSRHGARYPTSGSGATTFGQKVVNATGHFNATGELAFLNGWKNTIAPGANILVPVGKQELFDSGTLHYYEYGHLYPNNGTKIIARSTTQDRMTQSAEYFLAGFFGLQWTQNATLELIIEEDGFNNSLAGYDVCNNSNTAVSAGGDAAQAQWAAIYLANATARLAPLAPGLNLSVTDIYNMQSTCAYETVALGYSEFCDLFTYEEWEGYEYSVDIDFAGDDAFQSPTGRAVGIGYVEEVLARLNHHLITSPTAQVNYTLDGSPSTFPTNQSLYFDFSHDTNIMSILTAFGFTQFAPLLPATHMVPHDLIVSHLEPFGARLDIELIEAPAPVSADRSNASGVYLEGPPTTYIHFILNQRTLPLYKSFPACGTRDDGWCEVGTFLEVQESSYDLSQYEYACFGNYSAVPYGDITDGAPL